MSIKVGVSIVKTVNLGNYESLKIEARYETSVKKDEDPEEVYDLCWDIVSAQVDYGIKNNT